MIFKDNFLNKEMLTACRDFNFGASRYLVSIFFIFHFHACLGWPEDLVLHPIIHRIQFMIKALYFVISEYKRKMKKQKSSNRKLYRSVKNQKRLFDEYMNQEIQPDDPDWITCFEQDSLFSSKYIWSVIRLSPSPGIN